MEARCEHCRHWAYRNTANETGDCLQMARMANGEPISPDSLAIAAPSMLSPACDVGVRTTADFGCVMFEAKGGG
jgi:hypothetical protein